MSLLDDLPDVESFLGIDLKTGSMLIAALGIVHPMAYGCTFFIPMSYLFVTIWILVALYFAASLGLFCGLTKGDPLLFTIWIWYALIFVSVMMLLMALLALLFTARRQNNRVLIAIFGLIWYLMTIYFILVVNSYRKSVEDKSGLMAPLSPPEWAPPSPPPPSPPPQSTSPPSRTPAPLAWKTYHLQ